MFFSEWRAQGTFLLKFEVCCGFHVTSKETLSKLRLTDQVSRKVSTESEPHTFINSSGNPAVCGIFIQSRIYNFQEQHLLHVHHLRHFDHHWRANVLGLHVYHMQILIDSYILPYWIFAKWGEMTRNGDRSGIVWLGHYIHTQLTQVDVGRHVTACIT